MKYTVEIRHESGQTEFLAPLKSVRAAKKLANQYAASAAEGTQVFLSFFRASDSQRGYINQTGYWDLTGRPWQAVRNG